MSSDLAPSHGFSVQRSFFCGDVIAITSWAPDVVNLVCPYDKRKRKTGSHQKLNPAGLPDSSDLPLSNIYDHLTLSTA